MRTYELTPVTRDPVQVRGHWEGGGFLGEPVEVRGHGGMDFWGSRLHRRLTDHALLEGLGVSLCCCLALPGWSRTIRGPLR